MSLPYLTEVRWKCLLAFRQQPALMRRPFLAKELKVQGRNDVWRPATGPTLSGLEKAGWVRRAIWGLPGTGMPFQSGGPISAWEITDAGREAVKHCPDTFPGGPVYNGDAIERGEVGTLPPPPE